MKIENVSIYTPDGLLQISKIKEGVAYDLNGKAIPERLFRHQLQILQNDWVRPIETALSV